MMAARRFGFEKPLYVFAVARGKARYSHENPPERRRFSSDVIDQRFTADAERRRQVLRPFAFIRSRFHRGVGKRFRVAEDYKASPIVRAVDSPHASSRNDDVVRERPKNRRFSKTSSYTRKVIADFLLAYLSCGRARDSFTHCTGAPHAIFSASALVTCAIDPREFKRSALRGIYFPRDSFRILPSLLFSFSFSRPPRSESLFILWIIDFRAVRLYRGSCDVSSFARESLTDIATMTAMVESTKVEEGKASKKIETFDDILPYVGEASRYQWFLFFLLLPFTFVYAFLYFAQFFITLLPAEHWCTIPELDHWNLTDHELIAIAIPPATTEELQLETATPFSRCYMYDVNYTELFEQGVRKANLSWPTTRCKQGWTFNHTMIPYASIATELEWVCDKTFLGSAAQSAFFVGSIIGGLIFGYIADHYGRIPALVSCNAVGFFASIATAFCNSFWSFCVARLIVGSSFDNCFNVLFIIVIEYVGPKYRTLVANMSFGIYFAAAASLLPWIAYWIADWRILSVVTAFPMIVAFLGPWIVPESARWYIMSGNIDKAIDMLKKFAKVNGKEVKPEIFEEFEKSCKNMMEQDKLHNQYTVLHLFTLPRLARITIMLVIYWLLIIWVFDGHVWNMKLLDPDVFTSFSLASMTELPAAILLALFLDRWGRRWMGFASMFMCGVFSLIALLTPPGTLTVTMAILARLGVNIAANIGFQYAAEMLPTVVRAQGVSLIHIIGYFAHIIGPYVIYLADVHPSLPLIVLGLLSFVDAFLTLALPETLNQDLPETLQEGNDFGKDQSFWWIPCISSTPQLKKSPKKQKEGMTNVAFYYGSTQTIDSTRL